MGKTTRIWKELYLNLTGKHTHIVLESHIITTQEFFSGHPIPQILRQSKNPQICHTLIPQIFYHQNLR